MTGGTRTIGGSSCPFAAPVSALPTVCMHGSGSLSAHVI